MPKATKSLVKGSRMREAAVGAGCLLLHVLRACEQQGQDAGMLTSVSRDPFPISIPENPTQELLRADPRFIWVLSAPFSLCHSSAIGYLLLAATRDAPGWKMLDGCHCLIFASS